MENIGTTQRKKTVGCKLIFTLKYNSDGLLDKFKTRLVKKRPHSDLWNRLPRDICSYSQDQHHQNTFLASSNNGMALAPTGCEEFLTWRSEKNALHQLDVKNAFLHRDLKKKHIWMSLQSIKKMSKAIKYTN